MRAVAIACAALASCGRINFDEDDDAGGSVPRCEPTAETCDGLDNNCDDVVDETCGCLPFDRITPGQLYDAPPLVWTGSTYLAAVLHPMRNDWSVTASHADGTWTVSPPFATDAATTLARGHDAMAWNGQRAALVWTRSDETIMLGWFAADATPLGTFALPSAAGYPARIVWRQDRFAVVWTSPADQQLWLIELDAMGNVLRGPIAPPVIGTATSLVVTPGGYAASLLTATGPMLALFDAEGAGTTQPIAFATTTWIRLGARPDGLAFVASTAAPQFQLFDFGGAPRSPVVTFPNTATSGTPYSVVAATPTGYRAFVANQQAPAVDLLAFEIAGDGSVSAPTTIISAANPSGWGSPSALGLGSRTTTAWIYSEANVPSLRLFQRCD